MAVNLPPTCGPATNGYDFILPLSWSSSCEVAQVLSDIPFISVGILVLGISTLFLVLRRAFLSVVFLFFSTLLAFTAAVLDLGRILANDAAMSTTLATSEPAAVRAREVLLAFSIGLRFLFYWSYVAEPPLRARCAASNCRVHRTGFLAPERTYEPHSASWTRRGLPGKLLCVFLLIAIALITALQVVWRVVPRFHQYGNVYATDAVLELLASFLLLLKLLWNTIVLDPTDSILVHTFRECLAPISGLLVNIAIGVGSLLYFAFTESTVGRLLQALEVYVVAVFVVIIAFLRHRNILSVTSPQARTSGDVVFILPEPPRGSIFRVTTPVVETPRMSTVLATMAKSRESSREALRRSARRSLNLVSSWMSSKTSKNLLHCEDEAARLWNAKDVSGKVNSPHARNMGTELRASIMSLTQESKEWELVRDAPTNCMAITSVLDAQSATTRSMEASTHGDRTLHPYRPKVLQRAIPLRDQTSLVPIPPFPPPTSPAAMPAGSISGLSEGSPVYGFDGIQSCTHASGSWTPLGELPKQQNQLNQSIDALKSSSTRTSTKSSSSNPVLNHKSVELSRSPSTGQRTVSSDVSLSNFPVPPWLTSPVTSLPSPRLSSTKRIRDRGVRLATTGPNLTRDTHRRVNAESSESLVDTLKSLRLDSVPHSPSGEGNESVSAKAGKYSDAGGVGYNVTSFIGGRLLTDSTGTVSDVKEGLATPDEPREDKRWCPTGGGPSAGAIQATGSSTKLPPRTLPVPQRLEEPLVFPAVATSIHPSKLSQGNIVDVPADAVHNQISGQMTRSVMSAHSPRTTVSERTRNGIMRETGSPTTMPAERADRAQRTFARPRPPPLTLELHTEQKSGIPRVQVLADD